MAVVVVVIQYQVGMSREASPPTPLLEERGDKKSLSPGLSPVGEGDKKGLSPGLSPAGEGDKKRPHPARVRPYFIAGRLLHCNLLSADDVDALLRPLQALSGDIVYGSLAFGEGRGEADASRTIAFEEVCLDG